jgi:hypothetical protein
MLPKTIGKVLFLGAIMLVMGLGVVACDDGGGSGNGLDDGLGENGEAQCPPYPTAPHQWNMSQVVPPTTFEGFDEDLNMENLWCQKAIKSVAFVLGAPG